MLPHDFPAWQTTYYYFRKWRDAEWFVNWNDDLRVEVRQDRDGAKILLDEVKDFLPRLRLIWADGGYDLRPALANRLAQRGCQRLPRLASALGR